MKNIVEPKWLYENKDNVIIVDATNNFMVPEEGRQKHDKEHIENAFHIDLKKDMCGEVKEHGGRDPLPEDMNRFRQKLEEIGISNNSQIIVYDENLVPSSRFWWMCKYIGLENVKVMNGGINAWKSLGYEVTDIPTPLPEHQGKIAMNIKKEMLADIDDIRAVLRNQQEGKKAAIVDSRSPIRYKGQCETIDKKAGHIPNALNYFYEDVIDPIKGYKDVEFLQKHYEELRKYNEIIVHCGSGVSGSVNIIAMDEAGIRSKFYVGSWSDYITYEDSLISVEL